MSTPSPHSNLSPHPHATSHLLLHHELHPHPAAFTVTPLADNPERQPEPVRPSRPSLPAEETVNGVHSTTCKTCDCGTQTEDSQDAEGVFVSEVGEQDEAGGSLSGNDIVRVLDEEVGRYVGEKGRGTEVDCESNQQVSTSKEQSSTESLEPKVDGLLVDGEGLTVLSVASETGHSINTAFEEWVQKASSIQQQPAPPSGLVGGSDDAAEQTSSQETSPAKEHGSPGVVGGAVQSAQQTSGQETSPSNEHEIPGVIDGPDKSSQQTSNVETSPPNENNSRGDIGGADHAAKQTSTQETSSPNQHGSLEVVSGAESLAQQTSSQATSPPNEHDSPWSLVTSSDSSKEVKEVIELLSGSSTAPANVPEISNGRPWWKSVVAYQVWPMSFKDSNGDGIGDLPGIISKLDYLKDFGIDMIWLSPTYKSPLDDWGYDISDYQEMHDQFGTLSDIETLIKEVHARGMRIILDLVITHTSDQHAWFKESAKSKDNPKADWYMWADKRPGNMIKGQLVEEPSNWRAAFGGSAWTYTPARDQYYIHLFLESQPDLNWHNAEMREAVYQSSIKFWIDRGVDGFRLDTANRFCKNPQYPDVEVSVPGKWQPGSQHYINGPEMHKWLKEIRTKMDRDSNSKDLMIVGELPLTPYEELLKYVHPDEKELSMVFDFDMVKLGNNDNPDEYAKHQVSNYMDHDESYTLPLFKGALMKAQSLITDSGAWCTVFMENHDQPRSIARYATPEHKYWRKAGKLLALLQTTLSGTEFIYQGQEIGMLNMPESWGISEFRDPDAKIYVEDYSNDYREIDPNARENAVHGVFKVGRDNSRTPMQWSSAANGGFTGSNPTWMKVNDNFSWLNVEAQQADPDSIWNFWKDRITMRKVYKELFMFGTFALYDYGNERMFTYTKMASDGGGMMALVVLNFSNEECELNTTQKHLLGHTFRLVASNVEGGGERLQAWEGRVYIVREGLEGGAGKEG